MRNSKAYSIQVGWGLLWCGCVMWATAVCAQSDEAANAPEVVYLHTEYLPYADGQPDILPYRLGREIMRQAVLIAARDELGCATRDATLMETAPTEVNALHLRATERARTTGKWRLSLARLDQGGAAWEKTYDFVVHGGKIYADIIPKIEADTRSELVNALRSAGVAGAKPARRNPQPPGPEIEQLLNSVDIVAQFGAVRTAHAAIARHGETPEWLGVLVRGYANLSLLTAHYWYSAPEVFTARAWIYAQRMVAADPQNELALWHRTYAWTLGGALQHAQTDLATLEQRRAAAGAAATNLPPWTKLIKVYLHADRSGLDQVGKENIANRGWSLLLKFHLATCYQEGHLMIDTAKVIDETCPTAYGVYGNLVTHSYYLYLSRFGARRGPYRFAEQVPQSLLKLPDLPLSVKSVAVKSPAKRPQSDDDEAEAVEPFSSIPMDAADRLRSEAARTFGEPSWSALGSMLEEEQFLLAVRYITDAQNATEHDLSSVINRLLTLVKRHRYAAWVESQRYDRTRDSATLVKLFGAMQVTDPRMNMMPLFIRFWGIPEATGGRFGESTMPQAQRNFTLQGMMEFVAGFAANPNAGPPEVLNMLVDELREVAPQWECTTLYGLNWLKTPTPERLQQFEQALKESPIGWAYLAHYYNSLGDTENAARCARRALDVAPLSDATLLLANIYRQQGNWDKWEETLTGFLETPDLGLAHGPALETLALGLAARGQWKRAKGFALQYAQTYSAAGLTVATVITEGLAEWEESEEWVRALSTSYPSNQGLHWYLWCRRTGRGDVDAAKRYAEQFLAGNRLTDRHTAFLAGVFYETNGNLAKALEAYQVALSAAPSYNFSFKVARLARQTGNDRLRTETLNAAQKIQLEFDDDSPLAERQVVAAGVAVLQLMKTGDCSPERLAKIEQRLSELDASGFAISACDLAMELSALGKTEEAEKYWRRCLVTADADWGSATLAGYQLAKLHGKSRPDDDVLDESDLWPPLKAVEPPPAEKK